MLEKQFISSERAADLQSDVKESETLWRRMESARVDQWNEYIPFLSL